MALDLSLSVHDEPSSNDLKPHTVKLEPTQGPEVQSEQISDLSSVQLGLFQSENGSCVKQELQRLYEIFHSWLQPEKHSKEEMISQLVIEQFLMTGHYKDKSALKAKWESSGRNMKNFMKTLTDDCMTPPVLVHVCMQEQEALFTENMSLKEVIMNLKKESSAKTPTGDNERPHFLTQDPPMETGDEDQQGGCNNLWTTAKLNGSTSQGKQIDSLSIIQRVNHPKPEEEEIPCGNSSSSGGPTQGTSRSQEWSKKGLSDHCNPEEVRPEFLPRPEQFSSEPVQTHQGNQEKSTSEEQPKRLPRIQKPYKCDECSKAFPHPCSLKAHQKRHRNERSFVCSECHKGFFQLSDLKVHQVIHTGEKRYRCDTCEKSFSHKTNLQAHQRIHTGEKPYTCSLCQRSFRQSSTYHRHLRSHHTK